MMRLSLAALILLAAPLAAAEPLILPKDGFYAGMVKVETPSGWACLSQNFEPVELVLLEGDEKDGYRTCIVHGQAGKYAVLQINGFKVTTHKVTLGGPVPPGPTPVPPGPTPVPDPPEPPPDPTPSPGPRAVILIRETAETTPALSRLITGLRSGPAADYLKSHGHKLSILDDDAVDSSGQPSAVVKAWLNAIGNMPLPALVVADVTDGKTKVLYTATLTDAATTETVLNTLKANGG